MAASNGGIVAQDAGSILDYLIGGLGHLVNAVRNTVFMALEHELAPLDLTSSQFIVVIGAMRKRARTHHQRILPVRRNRRRPDVAPAGPP